LVCVSNYRRTISEHKRVLMLLGILIFLYITTGYVLTGYPLMPASLGGLPELFWAMPSKLLDYETKLIYSWARAPGVTDPSVVLGNWQWFGPWLNALPLGMWLPILLGTALGLFNTLRFKRILLADQRLFLLYIPIISSLVFWFSTAPDPRFIGVVPILYLSLSCLIWARLSLADKTGLQEKLLTRPLVRIILITVLSLLCIKQLGLKSVSLNGWVAIPTPVLQQQLTKQNDKVFSAVKNAQCWNAPLPCAAAVDGDLRIEWYSLDLLGAQLGRGRYVFSIR